MYFDINTSRARKTFKRLLGQANHYLITVLVGLDYIKKNDVTLSEEFKTSWNPRSKESSSIRSREFAIGATLSWTIDSLDAYLGYCHRKPSLYQDNDLLEKAGGAGQSADKKFMVLYNHIKNVPIQDFSKYYALTNLAFKWRNRLVHVFAENQITQELREILISNEEFYHKNFQGLEIKRLLNQFDNSNTPSFKEITSIVRGVHKFVELADNYLLKTIDKELHFIECLDFHFKLNAENINDLRQKTAMFYNTPYERRMNSLNQIIMNYGFSETQEPMTKIKETTISTFSHFSFETAMKFLNETNFEIKKEMMLLK